VEPQVVTITLDHLLKDGEKIDEVVVIYTDTKRVLDALSVVQKEFERESFYKGIELRCVPVVSDKGIVKDFCSERDIRGLMGTLYREVRRLRKKGTVHFCISGGRKVMGIMGMVVAQLLFGPDDKVWHLITEGWQPGSERCLHLSSGERVWLVPIPVLRWSEGKILMETVSELDDPNKVAHWYEKLNRASQMKRKKEFIEHWLTQAEREVVYLVCRGLGNAAIAAELYKSEQTVANQLRSVYEKFREWLGCTEGNVDRSRLIAEFAPYFALMEEEEEDNMVTN